MVNAVWVYAAPFIRTAMDRGGMGDYGQVEREAREGGSLLWMAWDGTEALAAAITKLTVDRSGFKECTIVACGGKRMPEWIEHINGLERFARAEGCRRVSIYGRPGWKRVLSNYRISKVILEKDIV